MVRTKMRDKQYAHYFKDFIWPWFMPSKEQYEALIEPIGFSMIPGNMKASFRKEVIQLMLERTKQNDGTCFETFRRINVTAIK